MRPTLAILCAATTLPVSGCAALFNMSDEAWQGAHTWNDERKAESESLSAYDRAALNEREGRAYNENR